MSEEFMNGMLTGSILATIIIFGALWLMDRR